MEDLILFAFLILAYCIGSLPTAIWVSDIFYGIDIRKHGSGNAGATNTFRVLGKKAGAFVFFVDVFKGWTSTLFASLFVYMGYIVPEKLILFEFLFGTTAVLGHIYPVFAGFRGGKGVATLFGMAICIHFQYAMLALAVFLVVFAIWHYVSLGSMMGAFTFAFMMVMPGSGQPLIVVLIAFSLVALVVYTHTNNIRKLIKGEESKLYLIKRSSK
jgi:glycerol-3-phosphate acyltransferase PlsY